jgi:DNA-directed RNA polymerase subunit RPC12/RpoP
MPNQDTIKFVCSHCGKEIEVPAEMRGAETDCPHCAKKVTIWETLSSSELKSLKGSPNVLKVVGLLLCLVGCLAILALFAPKIARQQEAKPLQPITGAFGFVLGERLSDNLPVEYDNDTAVLSHDLSFSDLEPYSTNFYGGWVNVLNDRRIYEITVSVRENSNLVENALTMKYGPSAAYGTSQQWRDSERGSSVYFRGHFLTYQDDKLAEVAKQLQAAAQERIKNEKVNALSHGL